MMKLTYLVALMFLILFSGCEKKSSLQTASNQGELHHILQTMPEQDRKVLDSFFQFLSRSECFSYTLFGSKPMSMAYYPSQVTSSYLYHPKEFLILEKGWEMWQSYISFFPSDQFVLKRCKGSDHGQTMIYLVNKKYALKVIVDNLDTFQLVLDADVNPQHLVEELCYSQQDNMNILKRNSAIGILLGFGKINSMNFERTTNVIDHIDAKMTPPFSADDDIKSLLPISRTMFDLCRNKSFSDPSKESFSSSTSISLAEELNDILGHESSFEMYGSDSLLDTYMPPMFAARKDCPETKKLHDDYLATRQKIYQAYQHGSFLEITLNQWMYPQ